MVLCDIGDTVQFNYRGGTKSFYKTRTIKVSVNDAKNLGGGDVDEGVFKNFTKDKIFNFRVIEKAKTKEQELIELRNFLWNNPTFGKVMVSEFNKRHGTNYKWEYNKRSIYSTKTTMNTDISIDLSSNTFVVGNGPRQVKFNYDKWTGQYKVISGDLRALVENS
jgi:hypothetical protein